MPTAIIHLLHVPDVPENHVVELEVEIPAREYWRIKNGEVELASIGPFEENGPVYLFHAIDLSGDEMVIEMVSKPH